MHYTSMGLPCNGMKPLRGCTNLDLVIRYEHESIVMPTSHRQFMQRAIELAKRGEGHVEPNPMVGCVIVAAETASETAAESDPIVGQGWHRRFGEPHAEIEALTAAGDRARDSTMYVSLEPCCHQGKTPPCTDAIIAAGVRRVVVATRDPFPRVDGHGIAQLEAADIAVDVGLLADDAQRLLAPYRKLVTTGRPWVIAKWAMSLDGKMATRAGQSQWISGEASRRIVHQLRGRVDAIVVGRGTAEADDPLLTARPAGPRTATRVVVDSAAALSPQSQLARTAADAPVLVACAAEAPATARDRLTAAGVEVLACPGDSADDRLVALLAELGRRRMTNVLVEGGARLLGSLFDGHLIDEVHVFVAPVLIGGDAAASPLAGRGIDQMAEALRLARPRVETVESDVYISGRLDPTS